MATGAFKGLKAAIGAGKDLQQMTGQLANWGKAFSDFTNLEEREKNLKEEFDKRVKIVE